ncbi:MAG: hypothetical protein ACJ768_05945 [Gaiellaceae bacterium]
MALGRGEYVFNCLECDGKGSIEVIVGEEETVWETCEECAGAGQVTVDEEVADTYVLGGLTPLRTPAGAMGSGQRVCPECGRTYDVDETRAGFDQYYADSAGWKWDDLPQPLCRECAQTDAEARWSAGELEAADGPPPSEERTAELMERFGIGQGDTGPGGGFWKRFRR